MLDLLRKKKESSIIKVIFVIIVLSFIGTIFLVWGGGEDGIGKKSGYAVKVDRTSVPLEAYQRTYQTMVATYRQVFGNAFTSETEKQLNLSQQVIDRLIDDVLVLKGAKKEGITVSKEEVSQAIAAMPVFQTNGAFDYGLYQQTLRANRITSQDYEESKKRDLLIMKVQKTIMARGSVTDEEVARQFHKERDTLMVQLISHDPANYAKNITFTDAELQEALSKNQDRFKTPDQIALSYSLIPRTGIVAAPVTEEEIASFYRKNMDRYLDGGTTPAPLQKVKERVRKEAQQFKQGKAAYDKVADTLFQNIKSGDLKVVAGKLGGTVQTTPLFPIAAPPAIIAELEPLKKRMHELKQGEIAGPYETSKGILIVKVQEKKLGSLPTLSNGRARIEQFLRPAKAAQQAQQQATATQKSLAAAPSASAQPVKISYAANGALAGVGTSPALMEKLFTLTAAQPVLAEPIQVGTRWYAARLVSRAAAPESELAAAKDGIRKRLAPVKQEEAFRSWMAALRKDAKIVINPALKATTP